MRRLLCATLLAISISTNVGCILPIYDADPAIRAELVFTFPRTCVPCGTNGCDSGSWISQPHDALPGSRWNPLT